MNHQMDHLACYLPGNLALGVAEGAVTGAKAQLYASVAANLTYTCWQMYARQPTGAQCSCRHFAPPVSIDITQLSVAGFNIKPKMLPRHEYILRL